MTKISLLATVALFGIVSTSSAVESPKAPTGKVPDTCQIVTITQPIINEKQPNHPFTFRGEAADKRSIELCNPEGSTNVVGVTGSSTYGARVTVALKKDVGGTVALPKNYANGNVSNIYVDVIKGELLCVLYRFDWEGGLKAKLVLEDKTKEGLVVIDREKCLEALPPARRAELKK